MPNRGAEIVPELVPVANDVVADADGSTASVPKGAEVGVFAHALKTSPQSTAMHNATDRRCLLANIIPHNHSFVQRRQRVIADNADSDIGSIPITHLGISHPVSTPR